MGEFGRRLATSFCCTGSNSLNLSNSTALGTFQELLFVGCPEFDADSCKNRLISKPPLPRCQCSKESIDIPTSSSINGLAYPGTGKTSRADPPLV